MNLGDFITDHLKEHGISKTWLAEKAEIEYKTLCDRIYNDRLKAHDLLAISSVLNINLKELKGEYVRFKNASGINDYLKTICKNNNEVIELATWFQMENIYLYGNIKFTEEYSKLHKELRNKYKNIYKHLLKFNNTITIIDNEETYKYASVIDYIIGWFHMKKNNLY